MTLEKHDPSVGAVALGAITTVSFRQGLTEDEAIVCAYRVLKRDHPGENPMCWRVRG